MLLHQSLKPSFDFVAVGYLRQGLFWNNKTKTGDVLVSIKMHAQLKISGHRQLAALKVGKILIGFKEY